MTRKSPPTTTRKDGKPPKGNVDDAIRLKLSAAASAPRSGHPRPDQTARRKGLDPTEAIAEVFTWKQQFIDKLQELKGVGLACKAIGYSRRQVYRERNNEPEFRDAWDEAWEHVVDELEASVMSRAINGYEEPVFHKGEEVGTRIKHDPILGIFMLKKNRPDKYDDRMQLNISADDYAKQVRGALDAQDKEAQRVIEEGDAASSG